MTTFVVTGDRSANPQYALPVVQQVLLKIALGFGGAFQVALAGLPGVEQAVQFVAQAAAIPVTVVEFDASTKDWGAYAQALGSLEPARVYFIHGAPESSRLYPALTAVFGDTDLELVDPDLLFAPTA